MTELAPLPVGPPRRLVYLGTPQMAVAPLEALVALTVEAPFAFTFFPHVVFTAGPTLDIGLSGSISEDLGGGQSASEDYSATEFGLQAGLLVYL